MNGKLLIVEDEKKLAGLLSDYLRQAGFEPFCLDDGTEVVPWVREQRPDLILLDLMLPGRDGMEICKEIRTFSSVPVIMVTARVEEIDRLLGLEFGADDYICKPFSPREVVARVRAVLRRTGDGQTMQASGFVLDESRYQAIRLKGFAYGSAGAYFVTICTHQRECLFGEISSTLPVGAGSGSKPAPRF